MRVFETSGRQISFTSNGRQTRVGSLQTVGSVAGRINGKYGEVSWTPIRYVNRVYSRSILWNAGCLGTCQRPWYAREARRDKARWRTCRPASSTDGAVGTGQSGRVLAARSVPTRWHERARFRRKRAV